MHIFNSSLSTRALLAYHRHFPDSKVNALRSFGASEGDHREFLKHRSLLNKVGLDSGAFSAQSPGSDKRINITPETHRDILRLVASNVDFYFNFDNDFKPEGVEQNLENLLHLEGEGFRPVPVVHDLYGSEIQHYIDRGYPMVAIGSTQVKTVEDIRDPVNTLYNAGAKIFLFGTTRYGFLSPLPIWGADSSTWHRMAASGCILYWNPRSDKPDKPDKPDKTEYIHLDKQSRTAGKELYLDDHPHRADVLAHLAQNFGFDEYDLLGKDRYVNREVVNIHYYVELQERITAEHKLLGFEVGD